MLVPHAITRSPKAFYQLIGEQGVTYAADRERARLPQVDMVGGWRELLPDLAISSVSIPGTHVPMMEDISHRKHLAEAFSRALL